MSIQIYNNKTPNLILKTPPMVCIFGLNKKFWSINLQFTNYKNDKIMESFLNLLENIDKLNKDYLQMRQTEYTEEQASQKLQEFNFDVMAVVRDYMGISSKSKRILPRKLIKKLLPKIEITINMIRV